MTISSKANLARRTALGITLIVIAIPGLAIEFVNLLKYPLNASDGWRFAAVMLVPLVLGWKTLNDAWTVDQPQPPNTEG